MACPVRKGRVLGKHRGDCKSLKHYYRSDKYDSARGAERKILKKRILIYFS
jgi:hypothetical protein